ncbi:MAG TPA: TIGR03862 family flavoprotein [Gammaproteobacteria bacterium]|jgi:hypothetical protein
MSPRTAAVIGGGPAGLMAAEVLSHHGIGVDLYDSMPSVGRKFLQAGVGGLNLTHSESDAAFLARYGAAEPWVRTWLESFGAAALRSWAEGLGMETFVGTSGRVFPKQMKAAPLLRAWLKRLKESGIRFHMRHCWRGWRDDDLMFDTPDGAKTVRPDAVVLAMGGGSWPRLGSDGSWAPILKSRGIRIAALKPANCGFDVAWSEHFRARSAGQPVKSVTAWLHEEAPRQGEFIVTEHGVEGGIIYALSAPLRDAIQAHGHVTLHMDLTPNRDLPKLLQDLRKPRGGQSMANHLRKQAGIEGVKAGLLREVLGKDLLEDAASLAEAIKDLPLKLVAARPLEEAISTAGGVVASDCDSHLMLKRLPGVFCAGEMLDWEAPTGGYLLTACFAGGRVAGEGAAAWLRSSA